MKKLMVALLMLTAMTSFASADFIGIFADELNESLIYFYYNKININKKDEILHRIEYRRPNLIMIKL